jgi:drug/metabolite transporter (DMT)-like permease
MVNKNKYLISFLLIFISLLWAGSFIAVKITVNAGVPPVHLAFLRFLVATPVMFLILWLSKGKKSISIKKEYPILITLGLTGVTFIYIFQYIGVQLTNASTSGVLINTNVIFILILSFFFLKEKISFFKILGISFSFIGVFCVVFSQSSNNSIDFNSLFLLGCVLVILSAFSWGVYTVVGKKVLEKYNGIEVTSYAFLFGTLFLFPLVFYNIHNTVFSISFNGWLAVLYLSILCAVFGYIGWYHALKKFDASNAAVFLNFIPLFSILLSFILLGEKPATLFIFGTLLIIFGVYLTQKS